MTRRSSRRKNYSGFFPVSLKKKVTAKISLFSLLRVPPVRNSNSEGENDQAVKAPTRCQIFKRPAGAGYYVLRGSAKRRFLKESRGNFCKSSLWKTMTRYERTGRKSPAGANIKRFEPNRTVPKLPSPPPAGRREGNSDRRERFSRLLTENRATSGSGKSPSRLNNRQHALQRKPGAASRGLSF